MECVLLPVFRKTQSYCKHQTVHLGIEDVATWSRVRRANRPLWAAAEVRIADAPIGPCGAYKVEDGSASAEGRSAYRQDVLGVKIGIFEMLEDLTLRIIVAPLSGEQAVQKLAQSAILVKQVA